MMHLAVVHQRGLLAATGPPAPARAGSSAVERGARRRRACAARTMSATPAASAGSTQTRLEVAERLGGRAPRRSPSTTSTGRRGGRASSPAACLVEGASNAAGVEHGDRPALGVQRERAAQRGAARLAVDLEGVVARAAGRRRCRRRSTAASGSSRRGRGRCPSGATAWRRRRGPCRACLRGVRCRAGARPARRRTNSCTSGPLNGAPNTSSSSVDGARAAEHGGAQPSVRTSTVPPLGPGHGAADQQQVLVGR